VARRAIRPSKIAADWDCRRQPANRSLVAVRDCRRRSGSPPSFGVATTVRQRHRPRSSPPPRVRPATPSSNPICHAHRVPPLLNQALSPPPIPLCGLLPKKSREGEVHMATTASSW
jgi:hypothetical protein